MSSIPPLSKTIKPMLNINNVEIMNKRSCPFDGDLLPQLKIHVGIREATDGNEKEEEFKKIYDRTMELLKNGPKLIENRANVVYNREKIRGYHFESPRFKQMIINDKLQLETSKKIIVTLSQNTCKKCGELSTIDRSCCFHCIDYYCTKCLNECSKCSELFCSKCIFTLYEGGEHAECLECYR